MFSARLKVESAEKGHIESVKIYGGLTS